MFIFEAKESFLNSLIFCPPIGGEASTIVLHPVANNLCKTGSNIPKAS